MRSLIVNFAGRWFSVHDSWRCRTERKEAVAASMAAKVKKRSDNIAMRHERRNEKRKGSGKSKGKGRPGFEGKSFGKKGKNRS